MHRRAYRSALGGLRIHRHILALPRALRRRRALPLSLALAVMPMLGPGGCAAPRLVPTTEAVLAPALGSEHVRMPDGFRLPLRRWAPATGARTADTVVLALHGFNDYANAFGALARRLAADGVRVYAVDQRGFGAGRLAGRWHGSDRLTADLRALIRALRSRHPDARLVVLGESMGAAVVLAALAEGPLGADALVLIAPAVWDRDSMPWYQRLALNTAVRVAPGKVLTGEGVPIHPSDNIDMLRDMGADPLVLKGARIDSLWGVTNLMDRALEGVAQLHGPVLLLYGERDRIIPSAAYCRMLKRLPTDVPGLRLVLYRHGWHMLPRDLQGARVRHDIAEWLRNPAAPLPSGETVAPDGARLRAFCRQHR
jgi:alpha-beta hydrolase superfamily lysophospholipase